MSLIPGELKYLSSHEWVRLEEDDDQCHRDQTKIYRKQDKAQIGKQRAQLKLDKCGVSKTQLNLLRLVTLGRGRRAVIRELTEEVSHEEEDHAPDKR